MSFFTTAARAWLTHSAAPFRFTAQNDAELHYADLPEPGLYVHIPFCRRVCDFCPYCKQVYDPALVRPYTDALLREIHRVGQGVSGRRATSLYFGGGTPALLAAEMGSIIGALREHFVITEGIGAELHPADVNERTLTRLREAGVDRISIGIQSFLPEFAKPLGRPAPDPAALADALQKVPFPTVSMDLIFALPGQRTEHILSDIRTAFSAGANHIATYPFIDFTFTGSRISAQSKQLKRRLLADLTDFCAAEGLVRDSIWTFARPGDHRYSSMTRDCFLGFGCSATSLLRDSFKVNTFSVPAYIESVNSGRLPTSLTCRFTPRQRMVYWLFWRAYSMHISRADFRAFFGRSIESVFGSVLLASRLAGFLRLRDDAYHLTPKGAFYFHHYENFYTLSYIDKMWGILRHTPFPSEIIL